jgi:hypothetical protein
MLASILTCKTSGNKHVCEPAKAADERRTRNMPIMASNIMVLVVDTNIHQDANDNENDDCSYFKGREPVFCDTNASNDMSIIEKWMTYPFRRMLSHAWR